MQSIEQSTDHATDQLTDSTLLQRIQAHDADAFDLLFARYHHAIQSHLARMMREASATEDLVQETFLRVWTRAEQWDGRGEVKSWLYRIATNLALNHLRSLRRRPQQSLDEPLRATVKDDWNGTEESLAPAWLIDAAALAPPVVAEIHEQGHLVQRLVDELPADKRTVFRMVYDEEMELREVADQLGIPAGTVKSRLHYSRKQLAQRWQMEAGDWEIRRLRD